MSVAFVPGSVSYRFCFPDRVLTDTVLSKDAVKFLAMKVSSISRDARRVLDICSCVRLSLFASTIYSHLQDSLPTVSLKTSSVANTPVSLLSHPLIWCTYSQAASILAGTRRSQTSHLLILHAKMPQASVPICSSQWRSYGKLVIYFQPYLLTHGPALMISSKLIYIIA
jgi:hypothetical protein